MMTERDARQKAISCVSRETAARLDGYAQLLSQWNDRINLVSASTVKAIWSRHILDSAQLLDRPAPEGDWADLGSGAGVPGLVVAILLAELSPASTMTLIESDSRKCAFLTEAARCAGVSVRIDPRRLEAILTPPVTPRFDAITARALAPLSRLLSYSAPMLAENGICIFPKGARVEKEVEDARRDWRMRLERRVSQTNSRATILLIKEPKLVAKV